jgi:hypothetical protein
MELQRYERIKEAMANGEALPPVVLYKLGYGYYVLDGNHRVAAARELGQLEIEADVTEFVPLGDAQAQRVFAERRAFERATGLTQIGAGQPGTYAQIECMIRDFAREGSHEDLRQTARIWESEVYRPVARRIRALRLGQYSPDQRTADVFVGVAGVRQLEEEKTGHPVDWEEALSWFQAMQSGRENARS